MKSMVRVLGSAALVSALAVSLAMMPGCGSKGMDKEKAAACATDSKTKESADECKACCSAAGANGHQWMSGDGCKCL